MHRLYIAALHRLYIAALHRLYITLRTVSTAQFLQLRCNCQLRIICIFAACFSKTNIMFKGKNTCKILKDIRIQIAESNDIEFVTSECKYQGDCSGTCPKCEAELRYLEAELNRRRQLGKVITLAGLSIGLSASLGGCHSAQTEGEAPVSSPSSSSQTTEQVVQNPDGQPIPEQVTKDTTELEIKEVETLGLVAPDKEDPLAPSSLCTNNQEYDLMGVVDEHEGFIEESEQDPSLSDVVRFVEEMPEFPGGPEALEHFLQREIGYPDVAKYNWITGTVLIEFIIEKDGSVSNVRVKVPLFPDCDNEAVRAIMSMPKWKPGKNTGKPVRCFYQVPVSFKIQ